MDARERTKELQAEFAKRGDVFGWFDALYREANGNNESIPWADLEPNRFFVEFAEKTNLQGNNRKALVVGCGLGDDAKYLHDLGFDVTAFDISETAIKWAKKLNPQIHFETADLFQPFRGWSKAFDFVLEIYTIQPLPLEMRGETIDAISNFVAENGKIVIVTRGREDDEIPLELPWALSRKDLSRFEENGLKQTHLEVYETRESPQFTTEMLGEKEPPIKRFVVEYERK